MMDGRGQRASGGWQGAGWLLVALMLAFTAWFSAYSFRLHDAHLTHKSDLGQMDLAIWNTAHGRFVQGIKGEAVSTRLTDHVEPIFLPVSLVFWLWDDVRALLILQAAALAAGAWPIYLLARRRVGYWGLGIVFALAYLLAPALQAAAVAEFHALPLAAPLIAWALWAVEDRRWGEFVIAGVLLAGVQEGMALLTATLGLYAMAREIGRPKTQLNTAGIPNTPYHLLAGLGVFLFGLAWFYIATFVIISHYASQAYGLDQTPYVARFGALGDSFGDVLRALLSRPGLVLRLASEPLRLRYLFGLLAPTAFLALLGPEILLLGAPLLLANLLSAFPFQYSGELHYSAPLVPFFIVAGVVGLGRLMQGVQRIGAGRGASAKPPCGTTDEKQAAGIEPSLARVAKPACPGRQPVLADRPGVRGRAGGLSHSAVNRLTLKGAGAQPLIRSRGAIFRADAHAAPAATANENGHCEERSDEAISRPRWRRLLRYARSHRPPVGNDQQGAIFSTVPFFASGLILLAALGWQAAAGYTPIGREFWRRVPAGWPQVTEHHRLLDRFAAQIPRAAALSITTDLYPHLSHRERIYEFPLLGQATWVLADVTGTTDRHPADVAAAIQKLLASGWGVVDAADGYILLAKGQGRPEIPAAFYDFARTPTAQPQHPLEVTFGGQLQLLGYDVLDEVKWRRTSLRFYWQVTGPLPADATVSFQVLTADGRVADDTALRPMPALLWYPPPRWKAGETIATQTLPWYLPRDWAPVITITGLESAAVQVRPGLPDRAAHSDTWITPDGRVRLPAWTRRDGQLVPLGAPQGPTRVDASFSAQGWSVRLTGWAAGVAAAPGRELPVALRWQAAGPSPRDYTVFLHLRDLSGRTVATGDATPTWFIPRPTSQWPADAQVWDAHALALPADLAPGRYELVVGWYYWETGERLARVDEQGNVLGDEFVLGSVTVDQAAGPQPDLACLLAVESCASLE